MTARDDAREYLGIRDNVMVGETLAETLLTALLAEHEALLARVESAPVGVVERADFMSYKRPAWCVVDHRDSVPLTLLGQTVRLLRVG